LIQKIKK